nr:hypothetical protein [Tanacetum cinerariifolium]
MFSSIPISANTNSSFWSLLSHGLENEVIENGNAPLITQVVKGVETTIAPTTAEEKAQRRLELKARSTLLMGIPNEHKLKFNSIKDAKSLLRAVDKRFRGNATTEKTQRNLLKQQYENFTASRSEVLDKTFDRLQKLSSQLKIHGESISQEDVNQMFLRSLDRFKVADGYTNNETIGFDKFKVECYNYHKRGHFARECRALRSQDTKHKESIRRTMPMETPASTALVSCDRLGGYDWSDQVEEEKFVNEPIVSEPTVKKPVVETSEAKASADKPKVARKKFNSLVIEDWISDSEDKAESKIKIEKKTVKPSFAKIECVKSKEQIKYVRKTIVKQGNQNRMNIHNPRGNQRNWNNMMFQRLGSHFEMYNKVGYVCRGFDHFQANCNYHQQQFKNHKMGNPQMDIQDKGVIDSGCSRHMTRNMSYLTDYKEIDGGYVASGGNPKGGKITGRDHGVKVIRCDNGTEFKNRKMNQFCEMKGKFDGKANEGLFVRYFLNSKAFRVFNNRTRIVEENLHIRFSKNTPNIAGSGPNWLFDIDPLTKSMNYKPVVTGNQSNGNAGTNACEDVGKARMETISGKDYILLPLWTADLLISQESKNQEKEDNVHSINNVNTAGINRVNVLGANTNNELPFDPEMSALEDINTFNFSIDHKDDDKEASMDNMDTTIQVSLVPTTRIHKDHPLDQVIRDLHSTTQTRSMSKNLEEHWLFLAYASFKDFIVYQMDVKSAFLYENIEEEVYVCQPPGFEDPDFPDKVGKIYKTLFIRRQKDDILLVQVYVDDIIFGSPKKELCNEFEKMMHEKFQMSFIGELTFFLRFQVKQKQDKIFISQDKYVAEILKKYGFLEVKNASTPMKTQKPLLKDEDGKEVDVHMYRSMISSLMKMARYYVCSTDSDYAGANSDRKSTTGGCQFLRCRLISWQCKKQSVVANSTTEAEYVAASSCCGQVTVKAKTINGEVQLQALVDGKNLLITESTIRRDLQLEDVEGVDFLPNAAIFEQLTLMGVGKGVFGREIPLFPTMMVQAQEEMVEGSANPTNPHHIPTVIQPSTSQPQNIQQHRKRRKKMDDSLERAATTATSLDAEQDIGNIFKTQSKASPNDLVLKELVQVVVPSAKKPWRILLLKLGLREYLKFPTIHYLQELTHLEVTTQALEIDSLKRRVKKLERRKRSRTHGLKRLYKVGLSTRVKSSEDEGLGEKEESKQGRIADIDANEDITLVSTHDEQLFDDEQMFNADQDLSGEEVFVAQQDENVFEKEVDAAQV